MSTKKRVYAPQIGKYRADEEIRPAEADSRGFSLYRVKVVDQPISPVFELKVFDGTDWGVGDINRFFEHVRVLSSVNFPLIQNYFDSFVVDNPIRYG